VHFHATADCREERNGQLTTEMFPNPRALSVHRQSPRVALSQLVMPQVETKPLKKIHDAVVFARQDAGQDRIAGFERNADCHGLAMIELFFVNCSSLCADQ